MKGSGLAARGRSGGRIASSRRAPRPSGACLQTQYRNQEQFTVVSGVPAQLSHLRLPSTGADGRPAAPPVADLEGERVTVLIH